MGEAFDIGKTPRARKLRADATTAENRLWYSLRARALGGYKFVRQLPVARILLTLLAVSAALSWKSMGASTHTTAQMPAALHI